MTVKRILQCKTLQGRYPVEIPSETDPDKFYIVIVDPWANRSEMHECSCNAYKYKHRCKHQKTAHLSICGWNELDGDERLTEYHRKNMKCPRCGNGLQYALWEIIDPRRKKAYNPHFRIESVPRENDERAKSDN